jgi:MEMO1 family protein
MSFPAELAKAAVELFVRTGERMPEPDGVPKEQITPAGAFVSLKIDGMLRGCIGTIEPTQPTAVLEIIRSAILAASQDPRFAPVESDELTQIDYSVDLLESPEPISGPEMLDPAVYGCVVESGDRRGLLLPDLEGVDTVDEQIAICRQKTCINPDEPVTLYRFKVKRYT